MKVRVKATGEVFEIASYATIPMECCDSFGDPLSFSFDEVEVLSEENDLKESEAPDYWIRLEHQYAGMAMQGLLSNHSFFADADKVTSGNPQDLIVLIAESFAHALVEELKEE